MIYMTGRWFERDTKIFNAKVAHKYKCFPRNFSLNVLWIKNYTLSKIYSVK